MKDVVVCEFRAKDFPTGAPGWCPVGWERVQVLRGENGRHFVRVTFCSNPDPFGWCPNRPYPIKPSGDARHLLQDMIDKGAKLSAKLRRLARKRPGVPRPTRSIVTKPVAVPPVPAASTSTPMPALRA